VATAQASAEPTAPRHPLNVTSYDNRRVVVVNGGESSQPMLSARDRATHGERRHEPNASHDDHARSHESRHKADRVKRDKNKAEHKADRKNDRKSDSNRKDLDGHEGRHKPNLDNEHGASSGHGLRPEARDPTHHDKGVQQPPRAFDPREQHRRDIRARHLGSSSKDKPRRLRSLQHGCQERAATGNAPLGSIEDRKERSKAERAKKRCEKRLKRTKRDEQPGH
jgi:hypothetical protein